MAKVTFHLQEKEHRSLNELALREFRTLPAQAALIIHHRLKDLGLLPVKEEGQGLGSSQVSQVSEGVDCD